MNGSNRAGPVKYSAMNPRHAAELALIGWYLMVPPLPGEQEVVPPISQWALEYSFDSAAACQALLNARKDDAASKA